MHTKNHKWAIIRSRRLGRLFPCGVKTPKDLSVFAMNLRQLRARAGLLQREVAAKIGRKQGVVSKWEHDKSSPTVPDLRAIRDFFNTLFPDVRLTTSSLVGEDQFVIPPGPPPKKRPRKLPKRDRRVPVAQRHANTGE